jgi:hypothetical protein
MIALPTPQTIGPAIPPLLGGDLSRLGSGERNLSRPSGTKAAGRASGRERVSAGVRASYSSEKPREARIKITANFSKIQNSTLKIQHCFPHPPTHPHPKSTLTHPKSTVDLRCGPLIKVENSLKPPLSPTCYRPLIRPENKGIKPKSNRHIRAVWETARRICPAKAGRRPQGRASGRERVQPKNFIINLCVWWPSARTGRDATSKLIKAVQSHSRIFRNFFYFYAPLCLLPRSILHPRFVPYATLRQPTPHPLLFCRRPSADACFIHLLGVFAPLRAVPRL